MYDRIERFRQRLLASRKWRTLIRALFGFCTAYLLWRLSDSVVAYFWPLQRNNHTMFWLFIAPAIPAIVCNWAGTGEI